jgi:hypothetical protein
MVSHIQNKILTHYRQPYQSYITLFRHGYAPQPEIYQSPRRGNITGIYFELYKKQGS